jgi:hypothetical protein
VTYLAHEVHPYVEMPEMYATGNGLPWCICGLSRTHHMHVGISSAVCTCMHCIRSRDPDDPYPGHAARPEPPRTPGDAEEATDE